MGPRFALLPSPLLGAVAWDPVRRALAARGVDALIARLPADVQTPDDVLASFVASIPDDDIVLVPHSNAGLYAPAVATAVRAAATVFVDAALPMVGPVAEETALAPAELYSFLSAKADETGQLPPWSHRWDESDLTGLFPTPGWQRRVQSQEPAMPLSYFASMVRVPSGWESARCAFVAFGDTYAEEIEFARRLGWPVSVVDGGHLHLLHAPAEVADQIAARAVDLGVDVGDR